VIALAAEGCTVAALDIDEIALTDLQASAPAGKVIAVPADLSSGPGGTEAVATVLSASGGLDVPVNNGGTGPVREFDDITNDQWQASSTS
jgi:NAD(P)-dependent dehydrogenase (short-subunit alcohol dehydrogenase family)